MKLYFYGVTASPAQILSLMGMENAPMEAVLFEDLSALVSETAQTFFDPTRENVQRHEKIIETIMRLTPILPASFGQLLANRQEVLTFLRTSHDLLKGALTKVAGKVELGLKAFWNPQAVFAEIEAANPEIVELKTKIVAQGPEKSYYDKVTLGTRVQEALLEFGNTHIRNIMDVFQSLTGDTVTNQPTGDSMFLNASFLVDRGGEQSFLDKVRELERSYGERFRFKPSGPFPPYNFSGLRSA
ncbi:MAG: GvpL/GvpF family gas vesicle protein [Armatimonadetes bacterium]|nr:GvpL/GvpF family gas vesicle protein [Armatimonadota bacterium]